MGRAIEGDDPGGKKERTHVYTCSLAAAESRITIQVIIVVDVVVAVDVERITGREQAGRMT